MSGDRIVWATFHDYLGQRHGWLERMHLRAAGLCTKCGGTGRIAVIWDPGLYIWERCPTCAEEA